MREGIQYALREILGSEPEDDGGWMTMMITTRG
jgi:hypothetical protein